MALDNDKKQILIDVQLQNRDAEKGIDDLNKSLKETEEATKKVRQSEDELTQQQKQLTEATKQGTSATEEQLSAQEQRVNQIKQQSSATQELTAAVEGGNRTMEERARLDAQEAEALERLERTQVKMINELEGLSHELDVVRTAYSHAIVEMKRMIDTGETDALVLNNQEAIIRSLEKQISDLSKEYAKAATSMFQFSESTAEATEKLEIIAGKEGGGTAGGGIMGKFVSQMIQGRTATTGMTSELISFTGASAGMVAGVLAGVAALVSICTQTWNYANALDEAHGKGRQLTATQQGLVDKMHAVREITQKVATVIKATLVAAFVALYDAFMVVIKAIGAYWHLLLALTDLLTGHWDKAKEEWEKFNKGANAAWMATKNMVVDVKDTFKDAVNFYDDQSKKHENTSNKIAKNNKKIKQSIKEVKDEGPIELGDIIENADLWDDPKKRDEWDALGKDIIDGLNLKKHMNEALKEMMDQAKDKLVSDAEQAMELLINRVTDSMIQGIRDEQNELQRQYDQGLIMQQDFMERKNQLDKKMHERQRQAAIIQAIFTRAETIFELWMNISKGMAKAVGESWITLGMPWSGAIMGMGVALSALIAAQPLPKAAEGGEVIGRKHSEGGTVIEAEDGEYVVSARAYANNAGLVRAINSSGNDFQSLYMQAYNQRNDIVAAIRDLKVTAAVDTIERVSGDYNYLSLNN